MKPPKTYSTRQVARMLGLHPVTLHKWQKAGKVRASHSLGLNGNKIWLWTKADVRAAIRYKEKNYRKWGKRKISKA